MEDIFTNIHAKDGRVLGFLAHFHLKSASTQCPSVGQERRTIPLMMVLDLGLPKTQFAKMANDLPRQIKDWRKRNYISQRDLASRLNVSQQAVSRWENGSDTPSANVLRRLIDLMTADDELFIEAAFIRDQTTVRALVDTDGARLLCFSRGFEALWPQFSLLKGVFLEDMIVDEMQSIISSPELKRQIIQREVRIISGTSRKQVDMNVDLAIKHDWHICLRRIGAKTVADMVFEPCHAEAPVGIKKILRISDFKR